MKKPSSESQKTQRFFEISPDFSPENLKKAVFNDKIHTEDFISLEKTESLVEKNDDNPLVFSLNRRDLSAKEDEFLQETRRFNELLSKEPKNLNLWLEFLNFQKKMGYYLPNSNKSQQNISEKQLSIVEKALEIEELKNNSLLVLLRIKLLKNVNKGEDFFRIVDSAWGEYIQQNPYNGLFWTLLFDFKFSNFIKFNVKLIFYMHL